MLENGSKAPSWFEKLAMVTKIGVGFHALKVMLHGVMITHWWWSSLSSLPNFNGVNRKTI